METAVTEKQALMIAVAILGKEKEVSEYGYSALKEAKDVLQKMLDEKNKKSKFKPFKQPVIEKENFKEMTIAEFEKQEIAKLKGREL
jgi:hypothetical protein